MICFISLSYLSYLSISAQTLCTKSTIVLSKSKNKACYYIGDEKQRMTTVLMFYKCPNENYLRTAVMKSITIFFRIAMVVIILNRITIT